MMYILRNNETESGKYAAIQTQETGYLCGNGAAFIPFSAMPDAQIVEVTDDYVTRAERDSSEQQKLAYNASQKKKRLDSYRNESDPLFFKSQRGEATNEEWLAKIAEINARYPYE